MTRKQKLLADLKYALKQAPTWLVLFAGAVTMASHEVAGLLSPVWSDRITQGAILLATWAVTVSRILKWRP